MNRYASEWLLLEAAPVYSCMVAVPLLLPCEPMEPLPLPTPVAPAPATPVGLPPIAPAGDEGLFAGAPGAVPVGPAEMV